MKHPYHLIGWLALAQHCCQYAKEVSPASLGGVTCQIPPPLHCPDANCPGPLVIEQGSARGTQDRPQILSRFSVRLEAR